MAFKITGDCINCGVCEVECPRGAILPGGVNWRKRHDPSFMFSDVPVIKDSFYSEIIYYVVPDLCNDCEEFSGEPKCALNCPMGSIVQDNASARSGRVFINMEPAYYSLFSLIKVN